MSATFREFSDQYADLERTHAEMVWVGGALVGDDQITDALREIQERQEVMEWIDGPESPAARIVSACLDFEVWEKPIEKWDEENDLHAIGAYLRERGLIPEGSGMREMLHAAVKAFRQWKRGELLA